MSEGVVLLFGKVLPVNKLPSWNSVVSAIKARVESGHAKQYHFDTVFDFELNCEIKFHIEKGVVAGVTVKTVYRDKQEFVQFVRALRDAYSLGKTAIVRVRPVKPDELEEIKWWYERR